MSSVNQVEHVCNTIKSDPKLANGYYGIGLSQGGLLIRGLAQRCPEVPIKGLVTYGAPSNGIFGIPDCLETVDSYDLCELARQLLAAAAYDPELQHLVAPAQYWRDPLNHTEFINRSMFLSDLDNLKPEKNQEYKRIITSLENFVMILLYSWFFSGFRLSKSDRNMDLLINSVWFRGSLQY
jgi:palmitoyl-protein thioesterase